MHKIHENYTKNSRYVQCQNIYLTSEANLCLGFLVFNLFSQKYLHAKTCCLSTVQWRQHALREQHCSAEQRWSNDAAQLRVLSTVEKVGAPFACQTGWTSAPLKCEPVMRRWQLYPKRYDLATLEQRTLCFLLYLSNVILHIKFYIFSINTIHVSASWTSVSRTNLSRSREKPRAREFAWWSFANLTIKRQR